jgi:hypothetical protein
MFSSRVSDGLKVYLDVTPSNESSTKADPFKLAVILLHTDVYMPCDSNGSMESTMAKNMMSQKEGLVVDLCPGSKSGVLAVLFYVTLDVL